MDPQIRDQSHVPFGVNLEMQAEKLSGEGFVWPSNPLNKPEPEVAPATYRLPAESTLAAWA
jgi:hypothetical protein